jgi:enolase
MITAKEATEMTNPAAQQLREQADEKMLLALEVAIKNAAMSGKYSVECETLFTTFVIDKLKQNGFRLNYTNVWTISWH